MGQIFNRYELGEKPENYEEEKKNENEKALETMAQCCQQIKETFDVNEKIYHVELVLQNQEKHFFDKCRMRIEGNMLFLEDNKQIEFCVPLHNVSFFIRTLEKEEKK